MEANSVRRVKTDILTANKTYAKIDTGKLISNYGAIGTVNVVLPVDAVLGDRFYAQVDAAQILHFASGAAGIFILNGTAGTAGQAVQSNSAGDSCTLVCMGANLWRVSDRIGTWSAVA
jgi:butyrate kinase